MTKHYSNMVANNKAEHEEQWTPEKEDLLVASWQSHGCLYQVSSPEYSNRVIKEKAWQEIATEVDMTEAQVEKRTSSLRTQYLKARKPQPSGSARKSPSRKMQWMLDKLQFLDPFIAERKSTSNRDRPLSPRVDDGSEFEGDSNITEKDSEDLPSTKRAPPFAKKGKEKELKKIKEEEELSILKVLAQSLESEKTDEAGDQCDAFSIYVSKCLKRMGERERVMARHQIENIIFQAQMGAFSTAHCQSNMENLYQEAGSYTGLLRF